MQKHSTSSLTGSLTTSQTHFPSSSWHEDQMILDNNLKAKTISAMNDVILLERRSYARRSTSSRFFFFGMPRAIEEDTSTYTFHTLYSA